MRTTNLGRALGQTNPGLPGLPPRTSSKLELAYRDAYPVGRDMGSRPATASGATLNTTAPVRALRPAGLAPRATAVPGARLFERRVPGWALTSCPPFHPPLTLHAFTSGRRHVRA